MVSSALDNKWMRNEILMLNVFLSFLINSWLLMQICRSFATMGTCTIGQKYRYSHPEAAKPATKTTRQMKEMGMEKMEAAPVTEAEEMVAAALGGSLRDAEAYINQVLYGSTRRRRRLPVFAEICPQWSTAVIFLFMMDIPSDFYLFLLKTFFFFFFVTLKETTWET